MSNHNPKSTSSYTAYHLPHTNRGFTLIEMLIVVPIVILVIGIFVSAIISMTGEVLSVRGKNALVYNIQDALNRIDQDVKSSNGYLATNSITLSNGQGYDNGTGVFRNVGANGTILILSTSATDKGPTSSTRNIIKRISDNQPIEMNVVYFVKNNILWRRVIAPSDYATAGASVPWQQPTCEPEYVPTSFPFCKTKDTKLVDGIIANGFSIKYHTAATPLVEIADAVNSSLSDGARQTALITADSISVGVSALKTIAGHDVSQSGSVRVGKVSYGTISLSGSNGGAWAYKRPIIVTNSTGAALTNYQVQINPFTDAAFINNTGLVGSWHMNEGTSTTTTDMSGGGNTGTLSAASWNASGKFGSAFNANSANYVTAASTGVGSTSTREMWFKPSSVLGTSNQYLLDMGPVNVYWVQLYDVDSDGRLEVRAGAGSTTYVDSVAEITSTSTWYHVVVTMNASNLLTIYVNGVQDTSATKTAGSPGAITIGAPGDKSSVKFSGLIDEVKLYNRALSASEVALRYGTAGTPKVRGDYADVRFANLTGTTEYQYWQETDGKYWVKIPSLAAGDTTINMYYGNPSATRVSNGDNTFIFFDDFESGNLNKWNAKVGTPLIGATYAYSGGYGGQASSTGCSENSLVHTFSTTAMSSVIAEYRRRIANGYSYGGIAGPLGTDARYIGADLSSPTNYTIYDSAYNAATSASVVSWRKYKVSASPTATTYYTDGVQIPFTTSRAGTFKTILLYACSAGGYSYFDDVIVRQFAATEPTHTSPGVETAL